MDERENGWQAGYQDYMAGEQSKYQTLSDNTIKGPHAPADYVLGYIDGFVRACEDKLN